MDSGDTRWCSPEDRLSPNFLSRGDQKKEAATDPERQRENANEGVKKREGLPEVFERLLHEDYLYVLLHRYIPLHGVYCARGEINKHIKPRDSFTLDKNMSRDTYLDFLLLIFPACPALADPLSISSFSFSPSRRKTHRARMDASLMTVLIMYSTISPATLRASLACRQHLIMPSRGLSRLYLRITTRRVRNRR